MIAYINDWWLVTQILIKSKEYRNRYKCVTQILYKSKEYRGNDIILTLTDHRNINWI